MSGYTELATLESSRNCLRRIAGHDELQFSKDSIVNVMERFVKTVNVMDDTILVPCRLMDRQVGDGTDILPASGRASTANQLSMASSAQGKRGAAQSKNVHEFLHSAELFNLYSMLNSLKNDLLWTGKDDSADDECESVKTVKNIEEDNVGGTLALPDHHHINIEANNNEATELRIGTNVTTTAPGVKGHNRRPSNASVASTASVSNMSDAESDISNENDSGIEFEGNKSTNILSSDGSLSGSEDALANGKKTTNQDKATELARRCRRHLNGLYQCLEQMTEAANYLTARYQSDVGPV